MGIVFSKTKILTGMGEFQYTGTISFSVIFFCESVTVKVVHTFSEFQVAVLFFFSRNALNPIDK